MIDAHDVFADIRRLGNGRDVLICSKVWLRKSTRIQFEDCIRVNQLTWDNVSRETVVLESNRVPVDRQLGWVGSDRNNWRGAIGRNCVCQILPGHWEVIGGDRLGLQAEFLEQVFATLHSRRKTFCCANRCTHAGSTVGRRYRRQRYSDGTLTVPDPRGC